MSKYVSLDKLSHFLLQLKQIIPTKTSDLTNDSNFPVDANYVHTDTNFTQIEKTKLSGIADGANKTIVDATLDETSDNPVRNKVVSAALKEKVDKVTGKGLSTNDYTTTEKTKLAGIANGANNYSHPSAGPTGGKTSGLYKLTINSDGHVTGANNVTKEDIVGLGIPDSVPVISTNVLTDATNDIKTVSPKAVKAYVDGKVSSTYKPAGSVVFANLPVLNASILGYVYNVTNAFVTTADFVDGAGQSYPAGTNVVVVDIGSSTYKFDVLAGFVDLSGHWSKTDLIECTNAEIEALFS